MVNSSVAQGTLIFIIVVVIIIIIIIAKLQFDCIVGGSDVR